jgi:hypothetical protein
LAELDGTLRAAGVELYFAELKDPVKDTLKRFELFSQFGEERFFPTIDAAVDGYLQTHAVEWDDWEEPRPPLTVRP